MERYESYKDSGVKWLGEIPGHWEISCLRRFLRNYSVKGHADKPLLSVTREKGVILRGAKGDDGNNNIIPEDLSGYKHVKKGQFVINKMKSWQGSYGVSKYEGIVSPAYFVYDLDFEDKRFFSWAIRSKNYIPFFMQYSKGIRVDQWDLTPENVKCIPFFIPPKSEQTAIANYLDSVTSKIDEAISQQQKMIDLLNERKQIIIQNAVTKGLDPNAKMKDSGVEWIGEIPENWKVMKIKYLFNFIAGCGFKEEIQGNICGEIPFCKASDIAKNGKFIINAKNYVSYIIANREKYKIIPEYSIIFPKIGESLRKNNRKINMSPCIVDNNCVGFVNKMHNDIDFLYYLLLSIDMSDFAISGTVPYINMPYLLSHKITIPSVIIQQEISNYLDYILSKIDSSISQCNKMISLLQERKQIIINDVVTGKVKVV